MTFRRIRLFTYSVTLRRFQMIASCQKVTALNTLWSNFFFFTVRTYVIDRHYFVWLCRIFP